MKSRHCLGKVARLSNTMKGFLLTCFNPFERCYKAEYVVYDHPSRSCFILAPKYREFIAVSMYFVMPIWIEGTEQQKPALGWRVCSDNGSLGTYTP